MVYIHHGYVKEIYLSNQVPPRGIPIMTEDDDQTEDSGMGTGSGSIIQHLRRNSLPGISYSF